MIIALGESIVALGAGATSDLDAGVIVAALLGFAVAACLWWAYFDVVAIVAERRLTETEGNAQLAMARDSYSYLHLPMVAGIILFAVGVKKTLGDVGEPLKLVPAVALCGGVAMYLGAHILFRLRNVRSLNKPRLVVTGILVALVPAALALPALATLAHRSPRSASASSPTRRSVTPRLVTGCATLPSRLARLADPTTLEREPGCDPVVLALGVVADVS